MMGWKTKSAGFASIAWGIWRIWQGDSDAAQYVIDGLAIIGLGHKLDRIAKG